MTRKNQLNASPERYQWYHNFRCYRRRGMEYVYKYMVHRHIYFMLRFHNQQPDKLAQK